MQKVLILGATSDISQALAAHHASLGDQLTLAARNETQLDVIKTDLEVRFKAKIDIAKFDALDYAQHEEFAKNLSYSPDLVYCVFGYLGDQEIAEKDWSECSKIIHSNYTGAVSILNIFGNSFEKEGTGMIVGISSVAGERGRKSNYVYGSAKAGFTAYLSGLRNRLFSKGVHVMTVKPGFMNTRMTEGLDLPGPLTAQPDQVAKIIHKAVKKKKNTIYVLGRWRLVMYIIKSIPEFIFKKLNL